jgi:hypothetical protein
MLRPSASSRYFAESFRDFDRKKPLPQKETGTTKSPRLGAGPRDKNVGTQSEKPECADQQGLQRDKRPKTLTI